MIQPCQHWIFAAKYVINFKKTCSHIDAVTGWTQQGLGPSCNSLSIGSYSQKKVLLKGTHRETEF